MALPWAKARPTAESTTKHYRNLERAVSVQAVLVSDASTVNKWFVQATDTSGASYFILATAGYASEAACQTAIETALGTPI